MRLHTKITQMEIKDIVIDFDGTPVSHAYPRIGVDIGGSNFLRDMVYNGYRPILFTMRSGKELEEAVEWFKERNIPLYGIQSNPTQHKWTSSPKAYGQLIIDDAALGCPLTFDENISDRPFVDWIAVREWFEERGLLTYASGSYLSDKTIMRMMYAIGVYQRSTIVFDVESFNIEHEQIVFSSNVENYFIMFDEQTLENLQLLFSDLEKVKSYFEQYNKYKLLFNLKQHKLWHWKTT